MRHPRAPIVQRAASDVVGVLNRHRLAHTTSDVEMLAIVTAIQVDVVATLAGEPSTGVTGPHGALTLELMQVQQRHGLTPVELLQALLMFELEMTKFLLRLERHPDDPDRRGDEA